MPIWEQDFKIFNLVKKRKKCVCMRLCLCVRESVCICVKSVSFCV
jgi:hypothetical protein